MRRQTFACVSPDIVRSKSRKPVTPHMPSK
jgi:hypothetical protein